MKYRGLLLPMILAAMCRFYGKKNVRKYKKL